MSTPATAALPVSDGAKQHVPTSCPQDRIQSAECSSQIAASGVSSRFAYRSIVRLNGSDFYMTSASLLFRWFTQRCCATTTPLVRAARARPPQTKTVTSGSGEVRDRQAPEHPPPPRPRPAVPPWAETIPTPAPAERAKRPFASIFQRPKDAAQGPLSSNGRSASALGFAHRGKRSRTRPSCT